MTGEYVLIIGSWDSSLSGRENGRAAAPTISRYDRRLNRAASSTADEIRRADGGRRIGTRDGVR
jgi:hypothetical protein